MIFHQKNIKIEECRQRQLYVPKLHFHEFTQREVQDLRQDQFTHCSSYFTLNPSSLCQHEMQTFWILLEAADASSFLTNDAKYVWCSWQERSSL